MYECMSVYRNILAILLIAMLFPSLTSPSIPKVLGSEGSSAGSVSVIQIPSPENVYSMQPVFILVNIVGEVQVKVQATIKAELDKPIAEIKLPEPRIVNFSVIAIPISREWSITAIPGLPAFKYSFEHKPAIGPPRNVTLTISTNVKYDVVFKGSIVYTVNYAVKPISWEANLPPISMILVEEALKNPNILDETLGLSSSGWTVGALKSVKVLALAVDDKEVTSLEVEYSVGGGGWVKTPVQSILSELEKAIFDVNDFLNLTEKEIRKVKPDFSSPKATQNIKAGIAEIPAQDAGKYVLFRAIAYDYSNRFSRSPTGLYYVVNKTSTIKVLVVDPSVKQWVIKYNLMEISRYMRNLTSYNIPGNIVKQLDFMQSIARRMELHGPPFFHFWNAIGKYYDVYIVYPSSDISSLLNEFKPKVVILSNLYLGFNETFYLNWDLKDLGVIDDLIKYIKDNHAGLIATHGTLSDWIVWSSDCQTKIKIGARGHVGNTTLDLNPVMERTIATILGMPELALWEFARDSLAMLICAGAILGIPPEVGAVIGSTPLLIPYTPFNGVLKATPEAMHAGWSLPSEFTIAIPEAKSVFGFKAYTTVGWQLALPRAIAYNAWDKLYEVRANASNAMKKFALLVENVTGRFTKRDALFNILDSSMEKRVRELHRALISSLIRGNEINLSVRLPEGTANVTISIPKDALDRLMEKLPVKVVAVSSDNLAAIIVHDKYWDNNGYRAVYFSFEIEASSDPIAEVLLKQAVEWVIKWEYKPITDLLGSVRVPKEMVDKFKSTIEGLPGESIIKQSIILNEEGSNYIDITTKAGKLHIVIAHPTTDKIEITGIIGSYKNVTIYTRDRITVITIEVHIECTIKIGLKASSDSSLNPAYVEIKHEAITPTPTPTPVPTPTPSPTVTPTPTPSPTPTLTTTPTPTPTPTVLDYSIWIIIGVAVAIVASLAYILMKKRKATSSPTSS
jgi:hypothetical protein